jgi:hypothetical protein
MWTDAVSLFKDSEHAQVQYNVYEMKHSTAKITKKKKKKIIIIK